MVFNFQIHWFNKYHIFWTLDFYRIKIGLSLKSLGTTVLLTRTYRFSERYVLSFATEIYLLSFFLWVSNGDLCRDKPYSQFGWSIKIMMFFYDGLTMQMVLKACVVFELCQLTIQSYRQTLVHQEGKWQKDKYRWEHHVVKFIFPNCFYLGVVHNWRRREIFGNSYIKFLRGHVLKIFFKLFLTLCVWGWHLLWIMMAFWNVIRM